VGTLRFCILPAAPLLSTSRGATAIEIPTRAGK
jgi:hypothetical protein